MDRHIPFSFKTTREESFRYQSGNTFRDDRSRRNVSGRTIDSRRLQPSPTRAHYEKEIESFRRRLPDGTLT